MNTKVINLALMFLWLAIGIGLWSRDFWMSAEWKEKIEGPQLPLVMGVAFMLALWNLMRYWVAVRWAAPHRESAEVAQLRQRIRAITGEDPQVTDPQFRFDDDHPEGGAERK